MMYSNGLPYLGGPLRAIISKASNDFDLGDSSKAQQGLGPSLNYDTIRVRPSLRCPAAPAVCFASVACLTAAGGRPGR